VLFRAGLFHRAITTITPKNEMALKQNAAPTPTAATMKPPNPGPNARARLNSIPFKASAAGKSSLLTNSGKIARHEGDSTASPIDNPSVSNSKSQGVITPKTVATVSTTATPSIQVSVPRISFRRSKMSPSAPAGKANKKKGSAVAV
jgi:hypothetical protein